MKYLLAITMMAAAAAAAAAGPASAGDAESVTLYYHESVGIPEAERIKQAEHAANFDGSKIIGGAAAPVGTYPFLVSISSL